MLFLYLSLVLVAFGLLMLFGTQVVKPLYNGQKPFPIFRKKDIKDEIVELNDDLDEVDLRAVKMKLQVEKEIKEDVLNDFENQFLNEKEK